MYLDVGIVNKDFTGRESILNHIVYDTSDKSFEYLSRIEFDRVAHLVKRSESIIDFDTTILAKIAISVTRFDLFNDHRLIVYLRYDEDAWNVCFTSVDIDNLTFSYSTVFSGFNNSPIRNHTGKYFCSFVIPDIYASYLATDLLAREREVSKFLAKTWFSWKDSEDTWHTTFGYLSVKY